MNHPRGDGGRSADRAAPDDSLQTANDLVAARLRGRLSRRALIRRATELGLSVPVVGVLWHATGDMAFGAPVPRRANRVRAVEAARRAVVAAKRTAPRGKVGRGGSLVAGTVGEIDTLNPYLTNLSTHPAS